MPQSYYPLEPEKLDAVRLDGLPRTARYQDETSTESVHVVFLDGDMLRTLPAADWLTQRGPIPNDPTQVEIDAAIQMRQQAAQQATADAAALRQRVLGLASSAVGVQVDALTASQVRALVALLLWRAGALDRAGAVHPLADWLNGPTSSRM